MYETEADLERERRAVLPDQRRPAIARRKRSRASSDSPGPEEPAASLFADASRAIDRINWSCLS